MPSRLRFRHKDTGESIEFDWDKPEKPTAEDLQQIYEKQHPPKPGMMSSAWDFVTKPISEVWGEGNKPIIPIMDQPARVPNKLISGVPIGSGQPSSTGMGGKTLREMSEENYAADPTLTNRIFKGVGTGATDALAWTSSPIALGTGAIGAGAGIAGELGYTGLARAGKLAGLGVSSGFTGSGAKHMYEGKTAEEKIGGAMEMLGGGLGLLHGATSWRTPPAKIPTVNGGITLFEPKVEAYQQAYTHGPDLEGPRDMTGFTELPQRQERPAWTDEGGGGETPPYMSGRYGISQRDWAANDPTLATVPNRMRPAAPTERYFDQMLPAAMREQMGPVETPPSMQGGPQIGPVIPPPEMGGPPKPPPRPRPRPQPRPAPAPAPPMQEPPIVQPPMSAVVPQPPDIEPLNLHAMTEPGPSPTGQMPEPTPDRMGLAQPRFRGPRQEPQTMPKKAPPIIENPPLGEDAGFDTDRPYARVDEPSVRAIADAGDMDAIRELHLRGVLERPTEASSRLGSERGAVGKLGDEDIRPSRGALRREAEGIKQRLKYTFGMRGLNDVEPVTPPGEKSIPTGNERGVLGPSDRVARIREAERAAREEESRPAAHETKMPADEGEGFTSELQPDEQPRAQRRPPPRRGAYHDVWRNEMLQGGHSNYEIDGSIAAADRFGEDISSFPNLENFDEHMTNTHGQDYTSFMDQWHQDQLNRTSRASAAARGEPVSTHSQRVADLNREMREALDFEPEPLSPEEADWLESETHPGADEELFRSGRPERPDNGPGGAAEVRTYPRGTHTLPPEPMGPVEPVRKPGRRAGERDIEPVVAPTGPQEEYQVTPEKLEFGNPPDWKMRDVAPATPPPETQERLMDTPEFKKPEDIIQPEERVAEKKSPIVPRVLEAQKGHTALTVKFYDKVSLQRVKDLFPNADSVYPENYGRRIPGRGEGYAVYFDTPEAMKEAHKAIQEHLYTPPEEKQLSMSKDLKSEETWAKLPKFTKEQAESALASLDPRNRNSLGRGYAHTTLEHIPDGPPGLTHRGFGDSHDIVVRDSKGKAVASASIGPDRNGKLGIMSLVSDETKGAMFGKALLKMMPKLVEIDAMRVNGTFSAFTENLIKKAFTRYLAPEAPARPGLGSEKGSTTLFTGELAEKAAKGIKKLADTNPGEKFWEFAKDRALDARMLKTSFDLSALRQAAPMIGRKEFWKNTPKLLKAFADPKVAQNVRIEIATRPSYPRMKAAKLFFADIGKKGSQTAEEGYQGTLARKVPLVERSEAAFNAFLSSVRADAFDRFTQAADELGVTKETERGTVKGKENQIVKLGTDEQIAKLVGNLTGRGDLGRFEPSAKALSTLLFSPRLLASRLNLLDPRYYAKADPFVRREALKSMLHVAIAGNAFALTTVGMAKAAGLDASVELDPRSSDFGKVKIGNTRLDPWEGFQQPIRLLAQLATNQQKSPITGRVSELGSSPNIDTRLDKAFEFAQSKAAPVPGVVLSWMKGKDIEGNKISVPKELAKLPIPLIMSDLYEVMADNPNLKFEDLPGGSNLPESFGKLPALPMPGSIPKIATVGALGTFGMGTQTFGRTVKRSGRRRARSARFGSQPQQ